MSQKVAEMHFSSQGIKELKYSPDGTKLAAGSHDCDIDIFDVTRGYVLSECGPTLHAFQLVTSRMRGWRDVPATPPTSTMWTGLWIAGSSSQHAGLMSCFTLMPRPASSNHQIIQSTCGAYELLYFDASTGKQFQMKWQCFALMASERILKKKVRQNQRDTMWHKKTATFCDRQMHSPTCTMHSANFSFNM
eukprot:1160808-Pelagomonas_calceolata.AAC.11